MPFLPLSFGGNVLVCRQTFSCSTFLLPNPQAMSYEGPTNETPAQIFLDIADINGGDLAFIAYGKRVPTVYLPILS